MPGITQEKLDELLKTDSPLDGINKEIESEANTIAETAAKGLVDKNKELLGEVKSLKDFKKTLPKDFTLEILKELQTKAAENVQISAANDGKVNDLIAEHKKELARQGAEATKKIAEMGEINVSLQRKMTATVVNATLFREMRSISVDDEAAKYLSYLAGSRVETYEEGDLIKIKLKDAINADGTPKGLDALKDEYKGNTGLARFIDGANQSGSGAPPSGSSGSGNKHSDDNPSPVSKIEGGLKKLGMS